MNAPVISAEDRAILAEFERRRLVTEQAAKYKASFYEFFKASWHVLEPAQEYVDNWHVKVLCDHMQYVLEDWRNYKEGKIAARTVGNLCINIPPGTAKSRIVSVAAPVWWWLHEPAFRWLLFSGNPRVTVRDSVYRRDLIVSEWFQKTFTPAWRIKEDANQKLYFANTAGGFQSALTAGQRVTGDRGDGIGVDDPLDAADAQSEDTRTAINEVWWDQAAANRVNNADNAVRVLVAQRLHEEDLPGHVLKTKGWTHVNLMQEYEPDAKCPCGQNPCTTPLGKYDPRTEAGELLFPQRFSKAVLAEERERLTEAGYAGQHQQHPYPKGGGTLKRSWFRFYDTDPTQMQFDETFQSWDMAFKATKRSDFVVGQVWGIKGPRRYLLDQVCERLDFEKTVKAVKALSKRWPRAVAKYIEDKANGPAVISAMQNEVEGMIAVNPEGGKEARANAVAALIEAGNVYLPNPLKFPWVEKLLSECEAFPNGLHDDQVDAMTQALVKTRNRRYTEPVDDRSTPEKLWDEAEQETLREMREKRMIDDGLDPDVYGGFV